LSGTAEVKRSLAVTLIIELILTAAVATQLVNSVWANPTTTPGYEVPPDDATEPPTITITSTTINQNNLTISFNASVGESATAYTMHIDNVSYTSDWNQNKIYVYRDYDPQQKSSGSHGQQKAISYAAEITGIPEGAHTITMYVDELGSYLIDGLVCPFQITGSAMVNFTIDTLPPSVTILALENMTIGASDVPLNFSLSEPASRISYVLDGKDEVSISGNTTLTGLPNGVHRITVYAVDAEGNAGVSETATFTVASFPVIPVAAVSIGLASVVLIVYFRKRKR
jgi:hypothetical protein